MSDDERDAGIIQTLVERLNNQRLPRALDLKARVDAGGTLGGPDIQFLEDVFADARNIQPMLERHPEYQALVAHVIHLYKEILDRAMENEKNRAP